MQQVLDMAMGQDLPVSESLGVFLSITGLDWLADGRAEPLRAAVLSLAAGTVIYLTRLWMKRRRKE